jgi:hypothetical protein
MSSNASLGANLGRQQSLRRTASDLSKDLAERQLPDPEVISRAEGSSEGDKKREQLDNQLAGLDGEEPEGALPFSVHSQLPHELILPSLRLSHLSLPLPDSTSPQPSS